MPITKLPYPAQFRQQMVELVQAGCKPGDLAKEFGCHTTDIFVGPIHLHQQFDVSARVLAHKGHCRPAVALGQRHCCLSVGLPNARPSE